MQRFKIGLYEYMHYVSSKRCLTTTNNDNQSILMFLFISHGHLGSCDLPQQWFNRGQKVKCARSDERVM